MLHVALFFFLWRESPPAPSLFEECLPVRSPPWDTGGAAW